MDNVSTELNPAGLVSGRRTEAYSMSVPECLLRQQKRGVDAELGRCDRLLQKITAAGSDLRIRRRSAWPQLSYRWELRDPAQASWTGTITLDELEMKQLSSMSDDVLRSVLEEKLRAAQAAKDNSDTKQTDPDDRVLLHKTEVSM